MRNLIALPLAGSMIVLMTLGAGALPAIPAKSIVATHDVVVVRDGCGIGYNRGPLGMCRPNGFPIRVLRNALGGSCPPTYHLGPFGHRCFSNY